MPGERDRPDGGVRFELELGQRPLLSPVAVQVLALLPLSQAGLDEMVAARVAANPALTVGPPRRCRWCASRLEGGRCMRCAGYPALPTEPAQTVDAREELRLEARTLVPSRLARVVDLVVASLDERGLLPDAAAVRVAAGSGGDELREAVGAVRAAGPPGVAAPDAVTSLLEQARWHAAHGGPALLVRLVAEHLSDVAAGDFHAIAQARGVARADVEAAVAFLRARLRPAPLPLPAVVSSAGSVPPDVIVYVDAGGGLAVHVLTSADLGLDVDPELARAEPGSEWVRERVADARALLNLLDRRAAALHRVAHAAVQFQREYVLHGPATHRPLTRVELAGALGLHPSTVTRAVQAAVVALPGGRVEPLSAFFGTAVSARAELARLLSSDDPPGSDAAAAELLAAAGYQVARRTVAKYRLELQSAAAGTVLRRTVC
ncbi:MAG TPA: hypothetical protein VKP64_02335 [Mycobacteriales bacterium]|nr:hypothetical protein [Mycobacteriales bacterium]